MTMLELGLKSSFLERIRKSSAQQPDPEAQVVSQLAPGTRHHVQ
jgi:hypothetical protein